MPTSENTYARFTSQQRDPLHVNSLVSARSISGVQCSRHSPSPPMPTTQPSVNHFDSLVERLNNLTLEEPLDKLDRAGLARPKPSSGNSLARL